MVWVAIRLLNLLISALVSKKKVEYSFTGQIPKNKLNWFQWQKWLNLLITKY